MTTLLRTSGVIDGTGTGLRAGFAVLIDKGRILAVDLPEKLPEADTVLELGDTILAGFIDAHTHISVRPGEGDQHAQLARPSRWQALRGVGNLRRMLESGVTTARIMGEKDGLDVAFKEALAQAERLGPRLFVAGTALSASHGHGAALGVADGPEEVRKQVRANLKRGADHSKVFVTGGVSSGGDIDAYHYSPEELSVAVEEAHRAGRTVAAHTHGGAGVTLCVEGGVDSVEHGGLLTQDNIEALVKARTWLVLTNTIAFHPEGSEKGDADNPSISATMNAVRPTIEATFERVKASGLRFALGTDSMHGLFGYELEWLVARGLSPEDAIVAATKHGAEVMGLAGEVGTLEPGKRADIVALKRNPLEDIRAVYDLAAVIKQGELVVDKRHD